MSFDIVQELDWDYGNGHSKQPIALKTQDSTVLRFPKKMREHLLKKQEHILPPRPGVLLQVVFYSTAASSSFAALITPLSSFAIWEPPVA